MNITDSEVDIKKKILIFISSKNLNQLILAKRLHSNVKNYTGLFQFIS